MKKSVVFVLLFLLLISMCGCGAGTEKPKDSVTDESPAVAAESPEVPEEVPVIEEPEEAAPEVEVEAEESEIVFTEQSIMDNDLCSIVITGIDPENIFGYTLKAIIENKTADKILSFSIEDSSVNGVKLDTGFVEDVNAGETAELDIIFRNRDNWDLIGPFTDIKLSAKVLEKDNFIDVLAAETVHIYPYGEDKAVIHQRQPEENDMVLLDNDKLSVTLTGYSSDAAFGLIANVFIVNKMDSTIAVMSEDELVNGLALEPYFMTAVPGGCCSYEKILWLRDLLEENEINTVDSVEFRLQACNFKNLFDSYADEPVLLLPDFTV